MSKHTPGPWVATFEDYRWVIDCQGEFGPKKALAVTAGFYPTLEANARLIASAPELLQMVIDLLDAIGNCDSQIENDARYLIAKATGEQA